MTKDRPLPWERQPGEGSKPFAAFRVYRDQPPMRRSLRNVAASAGKSQALIDRWSSEHRWVHRVAAWDAEQDHLFRVELTAARRTMARRLAAEGAMMQAKALGKITALVDRYDADGRVVPLKPGQRYVDSITISEAIRLIEVGARLEILARGLPEQPGAAPAPGRAPAPAQRPTPFVSDWIREWLADDRPKDPGMVRVMRRLDELLDPGPSLAN